MNFFSNEIKYHFRKLGDWLKAIIFTCEITMNNFTCAIIGFISVRNPYKT